MLNYLNVSMLLFEKIDTLMNSVIGELYSIVSKVMLGPIVTAGVLYFMLIGYCMIHGYIIMTISHFISLIIRYAVIFSLSLNWPFFHHICVNFFYDGSNQLSTAIASLSVLNHSTTQGSMPSLIQDLLTRYFEIGYSAWKQGGLTLFAPYFEALMIWACGFSVIVYITAQVLTAKVALSLMLALAPCFIPLWLFDQTRPLAQSWLGFLLKFFFLSVFMAMTLGFIAHLMQWSIQHYRTDVIDRLVKVDSFVPILMVCSLSFYLIRLMATLSDKLSTTYQIVMGIRRRYE